MSPGHNHDQPQIPGLYIHVPFCKSRCAYCAFYSTTDTDRIECFLDALYREIEIYRQTFSAFDTIYIGGGTPSLLDLAQIETILEQVHRSYSILPKAEITMEVNPADLDYKAMKALKKMGINRVSIGVQSLDDQELTLLGRRHNARQAMDAIEDASKAGFTNISIDLIYNLPGQTSGTWQDTLLEALSLAPSHLSCYELEIKPDTPMGRKYKNNEFHLPAEETQRTFFMKTSEIMEKAGYIHYEVSNFASGMGMASRHNQKYWDHTPYLGLGPSAHSFKKNQRWWNHASLEDYLKTIKDKKPPIQASETLDIEQLRMEALFLRLRTKKGIDLERYHRRYGYDLIKEKGPVLAELTEQGLIEITGGIVRPTRSGMAVADTLALI